MFEALLAFLVLLLLRPFWLWYWRVNDSIHLQESIDARLKWQVHHQLHVDATGSAPPVVSTQTSQPAQTQPAAEQSSTLRGAAILFVIVAGLLGVFYLLNRNP
jgi:hypothetical protein